MELTKKDIFRIELGALLVIGSIILAGFMFTRYMKLAFESLTAAFTNREFVLTDFAFVLVFSGIMIGAVLIYKAWKQRATFIYIAEYHLEVEPVDRRDEFLEMTPSYM